MVTRNSGRALEMAIGVFFEERGYDVQLNAVREGRSGGRHEIDVLAVSRDPVTTISIAVECKDWSTPVEKDVVTKLHYVLHDVGVNKGIVVSTAGCRAGAEQAARELGIDLWGQAELRQFLGAAAVARLEAGPAPTREGRGWRFEVDQETAARRARTAARGSAVLRRQEEVVTLKQVWVPAHLASLTVAQPSQKWGREALTSRTVLNLYDALGGRFIAAVDAVPPAVDLAGGVVIPPLIKAAKVAGPIAKAYEQAARVTTAAAQQRHAAVLAALGVPLPCRGVSVDDVELVFFPIWVAVLRLRDSERLVAISGRTANTVDALSDTLTSHIAHVRPLLLGR